jgi:hypothetical protein
MSKENGCLEEGMKETRTPLPAIWAVKNLEY